MKRTFITFPFLSLFICIVNSCPPGWNPSSIDATKCYFVAQTTMTWQDAENYCRTIGPNSHLTSVLSAFETNDIIAILAHNSAIGSLDQVWLGAKVVIGGDGLQKFFWSDGNQFVYQNWLAGQPNVNFGCVSSLAKSTGRWSTEPCETKNYVVCKYIMAPTKTATDCYDYYFHKGNATDGIYQITPPGLDPVDVWCEMTTDGGGWTVFQRRIQNTIAFYDKTWAEYKVGFSDGITRNLWLGNDNIHVLSTKDSNVELRIDLWGDRTPNNTNPDIYLYGKYTFSIKNEANLYNLNISSSSTGNASISTSSIYYHNGMNFSTIDVGHNSENDNNNCSGRYELGGWWMNYCSFVSLNGKYRPSHCYGGYGFYWYTGSMYIYPVRSRMMLRKLETRAERLSAPPASKADMSKGGWGDVHPPPMDPSSC